MIPTVSDTGIASIVDRFEQLQGLFRGIVHRVSVPAAYVKYLSRAPGRRIAANIQPRS